MRLPKVVTLPFTTRLVDALQNGGMALIPLLLVRYINTGDRGMDNTIIATVTTITSLILTTILIVIKEPRLFWEFCARILGKDATDHGFLTIELPCVELNETKKRVSVYAGLMSALSPEGIKLLMWISANTPVEANRPRLEFRPGEGTTPANTFLNFTEYNRANVAYPFYYVEQDVVSWEITGLSTSINTIIRISSTSIYALDKFLAVLDEKGLHKYGKNYITDCIPSSITNKPTAVLYAHKHGEKRALQINQNLTFDSLFFVDKDYALTMINKFKAGALYPKHVAACNKLGILLHGPPGTGKSAFVTALANMLNRSVIIVDMSKIKTCVAFDELLDKQPKTANVLFLEEMDCVMGVIRKRDGTTSDTTGDKDDEYERLMALYISTTEKEQKQKILERIDEYKQHNADKLHLGYILQRIDGIYDESGRVIVGCTNHPELIDPALLRPGRLGIKLELGLCTHKMIADIIAYYLQLTPTARDALNKIKFPENLYSPADLIQRIQKLCVYDVDGDDDDSIVKEKSLNAILHCIQTGA